MTTPDAYRDTVLFLDIDGVLNRCGYSNQGIESDKVALLKHIIDSTGCKVVLSSTWRTMASCLARVKTMLQEIGTELSGCTPDLSVEQPSGLYTASKRGDEIGAWLEALAPAVRPSRFVIIDDDADMGDLLPFLVKTGSFVGLTPEIADEVIRRLTAGAGVVEKNC